MGNAGIFPLSDTVLLIHKRWFNSAYFCARGNFSVSPSLSHKTNDWVRSKINFLMGPQEPLPATVERQKLATCGHVTRHAILSKKYKFRTPWRMGGAVVSRRNTGWTRSKSGHPFPCQNCLQGPPTKKKKNDWKGISAESSLISPRRHNRPRD